MIFEQKVQTRIEDAGKGGFITNSALLSIFETAGGCQSNEAGYGLLDIEKKQVTWILLDWKVKVIKRPMYGEKLLVKTWGRNTKKLYTYRDYELYNGNNELCAIATTKWVLVNINTKKIEKITQEVINSYQLDEKSVFEEIELEKLHIPDKFENSITFRPTRRNIDVNGHMHNIHYLELAYEALPEDIYEARPYNNLRISYKKEIKLGDNIVCNYAFKEDKHIVVVENTTEGTVNSIIELWN